MPSGVVLVEGVSDRIAIETLAGRLGRDLAADDVTVVPVGGAHAIGRFLEDVAPESTWPCSATSARSLPSHTRSRGRRSSGSGFSSATVTSDVLCAGTP